MNTIFCAPGATSTAGQRPTIVFRCDADARTGLGHLARSAALARALAAAAARPVLWIAAAPAAAASPWLEAFAEVRVETGPAAAAALVVDGYGLVDEAFARVPAGHGLRVAIDDGPPRPLAVDLLLEPNLASDGRGYDLPRGAEVLAGARFALLDARFAAARSRVVPPRPQARRVLVACGGADPAGMADRYLDALAVCRARYEVRVVIGPLHARAGALAARCARVGVGAVVGAGDLVEPLLWCDLALTTLGGTAAEVACLGVPALAAAVDPRQLPHLARYAEAGLVEPLGRCGDLAPDALAARIDRCALDQPVRRRLQTRGMACVDGRGAARAAQRLLERLAPRAAPAFEVRA